MSFDLMERENYDYLFKFILIGNGNSGKSSVLHQFINQTFKQNPNQTIGVEFSSRMIKIDKKSIKLQLWDTAGQERFRSVARTYYRGALGALILYDITDIESFAAVEQWVKDARDFAKPDLEIIIVGNKSDCLTQKKVSSTDALKFCQNNFLGFIETSALNGSNIEEAFSMLGSRILQKIEKGYLDGDTFKPKFRQTLQVSQQRDSKCNC